MSSSENSGPLANYFPITLKPLPQPWGRLDLNLEAASIIALLFYQKFWANAKVKLSWSNGQHARLLCSRSVFDPWLWRFYVFCKWSLMHIVLKTQMNIHTWYMDVSMTRTISEKYKKKMNNNGILLYRSLWEESD